MYKSFNIAVLSFFFLILIIPLVGIFSKVNLEIYSLIKFLNNDYIKRIIFFSFYQAFLSSLISCLIAIPFSLALNRQKNNKIVKIIISLCGFSFVIPSILIISSSTTNFHYDAGYYHLNHQNWLRESNLIIGMVNIFWPFGMSSINEYISAFFWFDSSFILLHFLTLFFIHFFFIWIVFSKNFYIFN